MECHNFETHAHIESDCMSKREITQVNTALASDRFQNSEVTETIVEG